MRSLPLRSCIDPPLRVLTSTVQVFARCSLIAGLPGHSVLPALRPDSAYEGEEGRIIGGG